MEHNSLCEPLILQDDIFIHIIKSYLNINSFLNLRIVCQKYYLLSKLDLLWSHYAFKYYSYPKNIFNSIDYLNGYEKYKYINNYKSFTNSIIGHENNSFFKVILRIPNLSYYVAFNRLEWVIKIEDQELYCVLLGKLFENNMSEDNIFDIVISMIKKHYSKYLKILLDTYYDKIPKQSYHYSGYLNEAIKTNDLDIFKLLVETFNKIPIYSDHLCTCVLSSRIDFIKYILSEPKCDSFISKSSALINCCYKNSLDKVKLLLKDPRTIISQSGNLALRYSIEYQYKDVVKYILEDERFEPNMGGLSILQYMINYNSEYIEVFLNHPKLDYSKLIEKEKYYHFISNIFQQLVAKKSKYLIFLLKVPNFNFLRGYPYCANYLLENNLFNLITEHPYIRNNDKYYRIINLTARYGLKNIMEYLFQNSIYDFTHPKNKSVSLCGYNYEMLELLLKDGRSPVYTSFLLSYMEHAKPFEILIQDPRINLNCGFILADNLIKQSIQCVENYTFNLLLKHGLKEEYFTSNHIDLALSISNRYGRDTSSKLIAMKNMSHLKNVTLDMSVGELITRGLYDLLNRFIDDEESVAHLRLIRKYYTAFWYGDSEVVRKYCRTTPQELTIKLLKNIGVNLHIKKGINFVANMAVEMGYMKLLVFIMEEYKHYRYFKIHRVIRFCNKSNIRNIELHSIIREHYPDADLILE